MDPYNPCNTRFIRDSRHAFGTRFYVEKPNRDYWYAIASVALIAVIVWVLI